MLAGRINPVIWLRSGWISFYSASLRKYPTRLRVVEYHLCYLNKSDMRPLLCLILYDIFKLTYLLITILLANVFKYLVWWSTSKRLFRENYQQQEKSQAPHYQKKNIRIRIINSGTIQNKKYYIYQITNEQEFRGVGGIQGKSQWRHNYDDVIKIRQNRKSS